MGRFQRVFKRRLEAGEAILKVVNIVSDLVWRKAALRTVEISNLCCVGELTPHVVNMKFETILKRRGGMATSFNDDPLARTTTWRGDSILVSLLEA